MPPPNTPSETARWPALGAASELELSQLRSRSDIASRWFAEEVLPHEPVLRSYLRGAFPAVRDIDDVVQESYLRLLKAQTARPIQSPRAFLFGIARRFTIDLIRRERRRPEHETLDDRHSTELMEGAANAADATSRRQEIALLAEAVHALPARCREVVILRKLEGLSHREIAARLEISIPTVEVQIHRGMEKLTCYLRGRGVAVNRRSESR